MLPPSHAGGGLGMMPNPELLAGLVETTGDILEDDMIGWGWGVKPYAFLF